MQPQVENAVQLLETDLRGLWPQLQDTIEAQFAADVKSRIAKTIPDFARQRRELLQSIQLTLVERVAGKGMEEQLARMLRETAALAAFAGGRRRGRRNRRVIAAMSSAAVADVTGVLAASAAVIGTLVAFGQRRKILQPTARQMEEKRAELIRAIEEQTDITRSIYFTRKSRSRFSRWRRFALTQRKRLRAAARRAVEETARETSAELDGSRLAHAASSAALLLRLVRGVGTVSTRRSLRLRAAR